MPYRAKKTKNMEERILVYKDESEIRKGKGFYESVKRSMQKLIDFLVDNEVEITHTMIVDLISNNGSSKGIFQERERILLKDIPTLLKTSVNLGTTEKIKACDEIIAKTNRLLSYSENARLIDFSKWIIENNKVVITSEVFTELEDSCSVYTDTPNRKAVYEKAMEAKKALEELNQLVKDAPQKGLGGGFCMTGIAPITNQLTFCILGVHSDGEVELNGELLGYIH